MFVFLLIFGLVRLLLRMFLYWFQCKFLPYLFVCYCNITEISQGIDITCTASGRGKLLVGDSKGNLHCISQDMKVCFCSLPYSGILYLIPYSGKYHGYSNLNQRLEYHVYKKTAS